MLDMKKRKIRDPREIVGKYMLVGLTYTNPDGSIREIKQLHGRVTSANANTVVIQRADGGGEFSVPFGGGVERGDPEAIYELKSTGETVEGVDCISRWVVHPPGTELR
jgi:hypothetical protein